MVHTDAIPMGVKLPHEEVFAYVTMKVGASFVFFFCGVQIAFQA